MFFQINDHGPNGDSLNLEGTKKTHRIEVEGRESLDLLLTNERSEGMERRAATRRGRNI
jgi:hypothetical protein